MFLYTRAEVCADLYDPVKIVKIRDVKGDAVALVIPGVFIVTPAGIRIAETREINDLDAQFQRSGIDALLRQSAHRLVYVRSKNCYLFHGLSYPLTKHAMPHHYI